MTATDRASITVSGDSSGHAAMRAFVTGCAKTARLDDDDLDDLATIVDQLWSAAIETADEVTAEIDWDPSEVTLSMAVDEPTWLAGPEDRIAFVASLTPSGDPVGFVDGRVRVRFPTALHR